MLEERSVGDSAAGAVPSVTTVIAPRVSDSQAADPMMPRGTYTAKELPPSKCSAQLQGLASWYSNSRAELL